MSLIRPNEITEANQISLDGRGGLVVPDRPVVPFIEGDGTGPDIWRATRMALDAAVKAAYGSSKEILWLEILAGEKAYAATGSYLPEETLNSIIRYKVALKGPLTTPVGGGFRSVNVTLRQRLDLYACIRPVKFFPQLPSPLKHPEKIDMVVFRENTEDVYAGIEWPAGTDEAAKVIEFLNDQMGCRIRQDSAIGVKPMSAFGSRRLIKMAIIYALRTGRPSVTMMHKGNIMKYTEGAFRECGYQLAKEEFGETVLIEDEAGRLSEKGSTGKVVLKDRIADMLFQQVLLRPEEFSVIATPNLNGDYISDALAAQIGGLGMAPGANVGDEAAVFEATHGSAPKYAGQDKVNPCSLILSGGMMLEHLGWTEAAEALQRAVQETIAAKQMTYDLARQTEGATLLSCSGFGAAVVQRLS
ncbi:MAG: isocitrate dehydrogenase (NADP(+)) [Deltaproteobacteria bacterium]|nr:isocitrate dehydrogenase (NADP(+)) [Deltaproteobacteria bacterium]MBF0526766.1 isocitrate dehydrogenase (NADP(+)) [Deltaproteobacteria bacterium]